MYELTEDVHGNINLASDKSFSAINVFISALSKELSFVVNGLKQFVTPRETKATLKEFVKFRTDYQLLQTETDRCYTNLQMISQAVNVVGCSKCTSIFNE